MIKYRGREKENGKETERLIGIYALKLSRIPTYRAIKDMLDPVLYRAWRERHKSLRDEKVARASLAGLLLLDLYGYRGRLLFDQNGRPYFADLPIDFNISHTGQYVVCAIETPTCAESVLPSAAFASRFPSVNVSDTCKKELFRDVLRVGIDAEDLERLGRLRLCPMAERWFTENEYEFFLSDPTEVTFARIWTRKEALLKWTGKGLAGLRKTDVVTAESVFGVRFYEYLIDQTVVTLCCRENALPPQKIEALPATKLVEYGFSVT